MQFGCFGHSKILFTYITGGWKRLTSPGVPDTCVLLLVALVIRFEAYVRRLCTRWPAMLVGSTILLDLVIHCFPIFALINPSQVHRTLVIWWRAKWLQVNVRATCHDLSDIVQAMLRERCRFFSHRFVTDEIIAYNVEATKLVDHRDCERCPIFS